MFELKRIAQESVPSALEKAHRYRLLNEPLEAESICRDVIEVEPENQQALCTLVLALTDQLQQELTAAFAQARETVAKLKSEYEREYYSGIICERRAKVHHERGVPDSGSMAYKWFRQAMEHFENAERTQPAGHDDAILRWNTCARIIDRYPVIKPAEEAPPSPIELE